ncbi:hypothetical protein D3C76_1738340 [compost metagenome]
MSQANNIGWYTCPKASGSTIGPEPDMRGTCISSLMHRWMFYRYSFGLELFFLKHNRFSIRDMLIGKG